MKHLSTAKKWILAIVLFLPINLVLVGCTMLSTEQGQKIEVISAQLTALQADYKAIREETLAVIKRAQAGEIPLAEVASLLSTLDAREAEIRGKVNTALQAYQEAKDSGVSPWMIIGSVLLNLVQGGGIWKLMGTASKWRAIGSTVIQGVEMAVDLDRPVKETVAKVSEDNKIQELLHAEVKKITRKM